MISNLILSLPHPYETELTIFCSYGKHDCNVRGNFFCARDSLISYHEDLADPIYCSRLAGTEKKEEKRNKRKTQKRTLHRIQNAMVVEPSDVKKNIESAT